MIKLTFKSYRMIDKVEWSDFLSLNINCHNKHWIFVVLFETQDNLFDFPLKMDKKFATNILNIYAHEALILSGTSESQLRYTRSCHSFPPTEH